MLRGVLLRLLLVVDFGEVASSIRLRGELRAQALVPAGGDLLERVEGDPGEGLFVSALLAAVSLAGVACLRILPRPPIPSWGGFPSSALFMIPVSPLSPRSRVAGSPVKRGPIKYEA